MNKFWVSQHIDVQDNNHDKVYRFLDMSVSVINQYQIWVRALHGQGVPVFAMWHSLLQALL